MFGRAELENNSENLLVMLLNPSAFAEVENGIQANTGYFSHCCMTKESHLVFPIHCVVLYMLENFLMKNEVANS